MGVVVERREAKGGRGVERLGKTSAEFVEHVVVDHALGRLTQ